jgi:phosphoribosylglycinamide formyltransferase-1
MNERTNEPMPSRTLHIGVLGSGSGSNMQSVLDAIRNGTLNAELRLVLSDVPDARILDRARRHGVPCEWLDCAPFKTKLDGEAERRCIARLKAHGVDTVVLAGFMRIVKPGLLEAFPNRVLNIHPALLPAFPGLHAWKQALDYGAKIAGCTVHFVDAGTDTGPVIVQKNVPVLERDTPETLHARIQAEEHKAYPEALRLLSEGRLAIEGRRVAIR